MVDKDTDFFKITNNFAKTAAIPSIQIIKSNLDFKPKVTIAIPTYRRANLLKETIDSAISQKEFEYYDIVVVDNDPERGCKSEELILSYNEKRISYYKNSENIGMAGNWNRLFELAVGDYVVMLHDDDLLLPNFLAEGMEILDSNRTIDLLKPQFYQFTTDSKDINYDKIPKLDNKLSKIDSVSFYQGCFIGAPTGIFFRKESVFKIGGYNQEFFPSLDYCFYALFSDNFNVFFYRKNLSLYRIGANESLNINTLKGFVISDYFLIKQILKNYGVPNQITKNYLRIRTGDVVNTYKNNLNSEFTFDFDLIGIKPINNYLGKIYVYTLRLFFVILNFVKSQKVYIDVNSR